MPPCADLTFTPPDLSLYPSADTRRSFAMRHILLFAAAAAGLAVAAPAAEAQSRKKRGETVIVVKQRSFLDAGTQVQPGAYQLYSIGITPWRGSDSIVPTGSIQRNVLPGPYGAFHR
jgi:hypothetical protein